CASGRVGSRQLIGEKAGEGNPFGFLFLYIGLATPAPIQKTEGQMKRWGNYPIITIKKMTYEKNDRIHSFRCRRHALGE
ncbi:hypothetical protein, partial [Barnesiella sp. B2-R-119]|uniref:hypothetical protein n=1 Tax=Barnesiella sp. B2-R-119 TaxID=2949656 RepID=UPI00202E0AD5